MFWAFVSGLSYVVMIMTYFRAVKLDEISRVVPLFSLVIPFTLILSFFFLGEFFSPFKYFGIFLLVLGSFLISSKKPGKLKVGKPFWLMIVSSLATAIVQVITKHLLNTYDYWTVFSWTRIATFIFVIPIIFIYLPELKLTTKKYGVKVAGFISLSESLNIVGIIFLTIATSFGFVTLVNTLSLVQYLFVLVIALILSLFYPKIIKEEIDKRTLVIKFSAIILLITGAIIIS